MDYHWSGKTIYCNGNSVRLTNVLSRRPILNLGECVIVAHGEVNGGDKPVIAKLRVKLDLDGDTEISDSNREAATREFAEEWTALEELKDSGHTPHLLIGTVIMQDQSMPCPGGYIRVLIMSRIPGQNVDEILLDLKEDEPVSIETQLAEVLEYMRKRKWSFTDPKPSNLHWDRKNKKLYLVDLEAAVPDDEEVKIGPKSGIVKSFMITSKWSRRKQMLGRCA
ncbi:MAG: hypothetical protein M1840_000626 [Geoglossum simile]|nr:MAG: hypothetical protein M1840_000626 [Geoglossum simile]